MHDTFTATATGLRPNRSLAKAEILSTLQKTIHLLATPGQVIELRIPGLSGKRTDSGYFSDAAKLAQSALVYEERAEGIYITLNPVNPALLARSSNRMQEYAKHTTSDKDVLRRQWIFVDFDPIRPAGISSSEAENKYSVERANTCRQWLRGHDIPAVLCNSGNGAHLLIRVDLPNDEASTELVKNILAVLDRQFSEDRVKVDTSTASAGHLVKLYGTLARKGDNIPERPHRRSALIDIPESLAIVGRSTLETLLPSASVESFQPAKPSTPSESDRGFIDDLKACFDLVAYAEQQLGVTAVKEGSAYRLPGNGGFIVHPDKGCWYHHGRQIGGDALDLVGHFRFGLSWNKHDSGQFKEVLADAAAYCGLAVPASTALISEKSAIAASSVPDTNSNQPPKIDIFDVAQAWHQRYAQDLAWDSSAGTWRRWQETHWQTEQEPEAFDLLTAKLMRDLAVPISSGHKTDGVIRFARALGKRAFNQHPDLVNFQNGTLDLHGLTLRSHDRADGLTTCIPYAYTPDASYIRLKTFLDDAIPDPEGQRAYMTHIGAALLNDTSLHKALVIIGPSRSGKTTLLKLAQMVLGYRPGQFATAILFSAESRGANSRATWVDHTPRLVCLDEFPEEAIRDEGEELFKSMTAHGGVSMWLKYRDERSENLWQPKLLFATNNRMRYRDQSGALTRRLVVVECPNALPDHRLDGDLLAKLAPELGAFAAACIDLALVAQRSHCYPESAAMRELLVDIETNGDAVKLWLSENCMLDADCFESTQALYNNFRLWCTDNGLFPVSRPKLRDTMMGHRAGIFSTKRRHPDPVTGEPRPVWGMIGLRLRTDSDLDPEDEISESCSSVPECSKEPNPRETHSDGVCSGVPVDSNNSLTPIGELKKMTESYQEGFSEKSWNTGTDPVIGPKLTEPDCKDLLLAAFKQPNIPIEQSPSTNSIKPTQSCWCCKSDRWWQTGAGMWICGICHPKVED